jgi:hypothetical protein
MSPDFRATLNSALGMNAKGLRTATSLANQFIYDFAAGLRQLFEAAAVEVG